MPQTSAATSAFEPGFKLGRYRLLEPIGAGGMGEVWKAHDDNLDRDVAIKMLLRGTLGHATRRERFRREALVLSRLSHPGVATIFDFDAQQGYDFLVMEYVAGGTLESRIRNGRLEINDILTIGAAMSDALDNAHRHGILHRDLKPGNVVMTAEGHPKILDFGLAVLLAGGNEIGRMTQPGMIVGSLPYMAPEQLFGEADDARTDIYALGVMLFEMITGERPFVKDRPESLMFAIVNTAAPSVRTLRPDAPEALERLVAECLRKDASQRPTSAAMVAQTLRGIRDGVTSGSLGLPPRDAIRAIAVLPLRNISSDSSQEYFTDGMTEAIISDLARIKALRVISRTSVMTYKGVAKPVPEIARELNVDAVLEGSALLIGDRVRVSVQLISARTDDTLWSERYDRELSDVLSLQGELAATVAKEIAVHLTPGESRHLSAKAAVNPLAHVEYLKARHSLYVASPEAVSIGRRHAQRALEIDPDFALAWAALADCSIWSAIRGMAAPGEAAAEATRAAQKALDLDPGLPEAHGSMGIIRMHSGDPAGGIEWLQKAVALNPGFADAYSLLGRGLYAFERHEEALAAAEKAVALDPLSMLMRTGAGDAYYFARDYEKSVLHFRMAIELDSRFDGTHTGLARSLEALGRFDEAREALETAARLSGGLAGSSFGFAHLAAASGNEKEARRLLNELIDQRASSVVSAWGIAVLHASLGDIDEAYRWLDAAIEEHAAGLILVRAHPRLDGIRSDPRYPELVRRVGLQ